MELSNAVKISSEVIDQASGHPYGWDHVAMYPDRIEALQTLIAHAKRPSGQVTQCDNCQTRVLVPWAEQFLCLKCSNRRCDGLNPSAIVRSFIVTQVHCLTDVAADEITFRNNCDLEPYTRGTIVIDANGRKEHREVLLPEGVSPERLTVKFVDANERR